MDGMPACAQYALSAALVSPNQAAQAHTISTQLCAQPCQSPLRRSRSQAVTLNKHPSLAGGSTRSMPASDVLDKMHGGARRACGGAADGLHGLGLERAQLVDLGDQHGHAQVLEAAGVADAAVLDPQVAHAQLAPEPLRPEQVAVALEHALDVVVVDLLHPGAASSQLNTQIHKI